MPPPATTATLPRQSGYFTGRARRLEHSTAGRLYRHLYVHPSRFLGDLQRRTGMTNYHRRLAQFLDRQPPDATVIDVGSSARRLRPHIITVDLVAGPHVDLAADAHALPLAGAKVDAVVIQQVLEHVRDPQEVVSELFRVLRPGGRVYAEVPFLYPVHDAVDFRRWTITGLEVLFAAFASRDAGVCMGPLSVLSAITRRVVTARLKDPRLEAAVDLAAGWVLAPLKFLDEVVGRWPGASLVAGAVFFEGEKPR